MKRGRFEAPPKHRVPVLPAAAAVLFLVLLALLLWRCGAQSAQLPGDAPSVEKNPDSISVPGYELLELAADTAQQTLCLENPAQNPCYFQITLTLSDGTLLWQSERIAPGKTSAPIVLRRPLAAGTYSAVLNYACFREDDGVTPLNGAEMKLTLRVK